MEHRSESYMCVLRLGCPSVDGQRDGIWRGRYIERASGHPPCRSPQVRVLSTLRNRIEAVSDDGGALPQERRLQVLSCLTPALIPTGLVLKLIEQFRQ
ncbi:hypothetical protein M758_4G013800 [Ceratodon purpureus]|nr:hypothetical protein KC19_4G015600 [Ceratodon purpureus]KAG0617773.1 hypothetical protein M758_4G013800 [Ceratodon purpureus]